MTLNIVLDKSLKKHVYDVYGASVSILMLESLSLLTLYLHKRPEQSTSFCLVEEKKCQAVLEQNEAE